MRTGELLHVLGQINNNHSGRSLSVKKLLEELAQFGEGDTDNFIEGLKGKKAQPKSRKKKSTNESSTKGAKARPAMSEEQVKAEADAWVERIREFTGTSEEFELFIAELEKSPVPIVDHIYRVVLGQSNKMPPRAKVVLQLKQFYANRVVQRHHADVASKAYD